MGNKGGPGNPFTRRVARLRQLLVETVREEGLQAVVRRLIEAAKCGNIPAARLVLAYSVGKPLNVIDPDRLDIEEWKLLMEMGILPHQFQEVLQKMPADIACRLVEIAWPCLMATTSQPVLQASSGETPDHARKNGEASRLKKSPATSKRRKTKPRGAK